MGGIAMRLLRSRARVQVDGDTQVEGQVERAVELFSRVEGEIGDFVRRDLAASSYRLEESSDLTPGNVDSLLQRLSGTTVQEIDHFIAELQALRQRLQHEATRVEREVVQYASLNEAARASMRTISENLSSDRSSEAARVAARLRALSPPWCRLPACLHKLLRLSGLRFSRRMAQRQARRCAFSAGVLIKRLKRGIMPRLHE